MARPVLTEEEKVRRRIQEYMRRIIEQMVQLHGLTDDEVKLLDLEGTPARVAKMWAQETLSHPQIPDVHITDISGRVGDPVVVGPIGFASTCAHHLMPFTGHAWVAVLPRDRLLGLSKYTRIIKACSKRFQLQEKLTGDVVDEVVRLLDPDVALVVMRAGHGCVSCRGVEDATQQTVTAAFRKRRTFSGDLVTPVLGELYRLIGFSGGPSRPY